MIEISAPARRLIQWVHGEYDLVDYRRGPKESRGGTRSLGSALTRLDLIELHKRLCLGEISVKETVMDRRGLLAVAHIAKQQLAIDDDDWRDLVERETGKRSCAAAGDRELVKLMKRLETMGFTNQARARTFRRARKPQARLCWSLWKELKELGALRNTTREAARHLFATLAGVATDTDPDFMSAEQLNRAIEGLKAMVARVKAEAAPS
jgi:phage gp16-like protein